MHLIVLEREVTSTRGGQELNLFEICRSLAQRGHRITLLYERPGNLLDRYREFCADVINISSYGFDRRSLSSTLKFIPSMAQLWQVPVTEDSLVFINDYHFALFGYALSYFRNLPYVCYCQIPPCEFNRQRRFGLSRVDRFVAVSHQTKQEWADYGYPEDKIEVVHNGTDVEKFKPAENWQQLRSQWNVSHEATLISYIGRIDTEKGLETLIKAAAILVGQGADVQVRLAGKPVVHFNAEKGQECEDEGMLYQRSLIDLADSLDVGDRVTFLGHVPDPRSLYQASDVSVLPSVWKEPFGRSIIESMACGTPVVASRIGGIPEILTGSFAQQLATPGDEVDLAKRLAQTMTWRDTDPQLGAQCRQHIVKSFSYESMINGIERVALQFKPMLKVG